MAFRGRRGPRPERGPQIRVNHKIRAPEVRVINPDGQMLGVQPIHQALAIAKELELDLVEVNPKANPPVCRIMDFGKFKYEKKKQESAARKKRTEVELKEVKIRPKTDEHDYAFKMRHVRRFLETGDKAKITIRFRGREMAHPEVARRIFDRIITEMADVSTVEQSYRMEGRAMNVVLAPKISKARVAGAAAPAKPAGPARAVEEDLPPLEDEDDFDEDEDEDEDFDEDFEEDDVVEE